MTAEQLRREIQFAIQTARQLRASLERIQWAEVEDFQDEANLKELEDLVVECAESDLLEMEVKR